MTASKRCIVEERYLYLPACHLDVTRRCSQPPLPFAHLTSPLALACVSCCPRLCRVQAQITQAVLGAEWWLPVNGSYWREPEGPGSDVFQVNN